jgi:AraC-like DNA-binding protein
MGVYRPAHDYEIDDPRSRRLSPLHERSSVAMATRFLDAALRAWDQDPALAKSQIKVAVAMLRGDAEDPPMPANPTGSVVASLLPWQTRKVREFIDASLASKIRLQDCASKARLSTNHFSRAFKASFGTTVLDYIRRRRVERAQHMMLTSQRPLAQIALLCGFADQAHYSRVFHAVVGLSPNAWRRQNMLEAPEEQAGHEGAMLSRPSSQLEWVNAGQ